MRENFIKKEEIAPFKKMVNEANSFRLKLFPPFLALYMLTEFVSDLKKLLSPERSAFIFTFFSVSTNVYGIFLVLDTFVIFSSALIFFINAAYKKGRLSGEKKENLFLYLVKCYGLLLLTISFLAVAITAYVFGPVDFTFFYLIALITSGVFYLDCTVTIPVNILYFVILNLLPILFHWNVSYSPYAPYGIFFIIAVCFISVFRAYYLLFTLRRENEIQRLKENADRQNTLKSMFLANMSHEIRTPMNAIVGMSELALDYNLAPQEKNTIRQIHSSGIALVGIINDILDFSKIESGKMEIVPSDYDMVKLLYDVGNVCQTKISGKDIDLCIRVDSSLPSIVHGDDMRIRQVLINLAGNAAKFTESGTITISATAAESPECITFSVKDTGIGIKAEDLDKIFAEFQQVDMKMNRTKGGTGLGLSISKKLVTLMGGTLDVVSEYQKGSEFSFCIPQKAAISAKGTVKSVAEAYPLLYNSAKTVEGHSFLKEISMDTLNKPEFSACFTEKIQESSFQAPDAKILIVDDNELNIQVTEGLLKKLGVEPDTAASGNDALEKLKNGNKYHIIFMDHQMPVMDGIETLEKVRGMEKEGMSFSLNAQIPHAIVIALSANAANGAEQMFLNAGFDGFVSKPVQGKDFADVLQKFLPSEVIKQHEKHNNAQADEDNDKKKSGFIADKNIIRTFVRMIEPTAREIRLFLDSGDIKNYTIKVHSLKSSALIVSAYRLSAMAEELESIGNRAGKEDVLPELKKKTTPMLELYESYKDRFSKALSENDDKTESVITDVSGSGLNAIRGKILDACSHNNLNELDDLVESIKGLSLSKEDAERLAQLQEACEMIDFESVAKIANQLGTQNSIMGT